MNLSLAARALEQQWLTFAAQFDWRRGALLLLLLTLPVQGAEKKILLRNGTITTSGVERQSLQAQGAENVSGLYLIQFEHQPSAESKAAVETLGIKLLRPVPEDAFVARLSATSLPELRALPFIQWVGPFRPEFKVENRLAETIRQAGVKTASLRVLFTADVSPDENVAILRAFQKVTHQHQTRFGRLLEGEVAASRIAELAKSDAVLWVEPSPKMKLFDAIAAEIIGGETEQLRPAVHGLGFDGEGVTVAVADSGLHGGPDGPMHPDLEGRVDGFFYYGNLLDASDEHSHGTHVTGIIAGDGATGETDELGYLYGLGIAPKSHVVAQRLFDGLGGYEAPDSYGQLTSDALGAGAEIGSNSWGDDTQGRYDTSAMEFDALVRDGDPDTAGDQPYILEFSAGNAGPGERTIGSPAVAKNVIATGAAQNNRFDFFIYAEGEDTMADFSSRGPCDDGRIKPDLVAPGTWISSLQSSSASDENAWSPISANYQYQGGTSQSGPQVSGAAAVFVQYYRELHGGQTPSPALVKAALINSAVDMDNSSGTDYIPNNDEGWGRVDLTEIIGAAKKYDYTDQTELVATGQVYEKRIYLASYYQPLKITLTYTDVPGVPFAIPALVNDLDLEVIAPNGAIYHGNQFIDGESVPNSPSFDSINNVEGVHLPFPDPGEYIVRVRGRRVVEDARRDTGTVDQDFALVVSGDIPLPGQGVIAFDRKAYSVPATIGIKLIDFDLAGQPSATVSIKSTSQSTPLSITMSPSGSAGVFTGAVQTATLPVVSDGRLHVAHGDTIEGSYQDADPQKLVTARAEADLIAPVISGVGATNRFGKELIHWETDEPSTSIVFHGTNGDLSFAATNSLMVLDHEITINGLIEGQTHQYYVMSVDEAGNVAIGDNNGNYYSFIAQPAATVLLVDAYTYTESTEGREDVPIPVESYTEALNRTGVTYEVWNVENEGSPAVGDLAPFQVVIWRINDSFWETGNIITSSQQMVIQSYLTNGGAFLLTSMDILTRMGSTDFRTNVLQVAEFIQRDPNDPFSDCPDCDEDHGVTFIEGSYLDPFAGGISAELNYSSYPVFELGDIFPNIGPDLSDVFTPTTNAAPFIVDAGSGRVTGVRSPKTGQDSNGRVVFLGFPLDTVPLDGPAPNNRANLLRNILSFLAPGVNGLGTISLDNVNYTVPSRVTVEVADSDLIGQALVPVKVTSDSEPAGITVNLEPTVLPGLFRGSLTLVTTTEAAGAGRLRAKEDDLIEAQYFDASAQGTVEAKAEIDTGMPEIFGLHMEPDYELAIVTWETDEPTDALIQFGESPLLSKTAYHPGPRVSHTLTLPALKPDRTYYYQVVSRDEAGNTVVDDNGGELYTFKTLTPVIPPWFDNLENTPDWLVQDGEETEGRWELGTPNNALDTQAYSPTKAWGSNLNGESKSYVQTFLISPAVELTGGNNATLTFWHNYDFFGESTFEMGRLLLFTNSQTQPITLANYEELTFGWEQEEFDLSPYVGKVVQLVWSYEMLDFTFENNVHPGWLVDDVSIEVTNILRGTLEVANNIAQATFTIEGPSPAEGAGSIYTNPRAAAGEYVVRWNLVPYYNTPAPQTNVLAAVNTLRFTGFYTFNDSNGNNMADEWEQDQFGEVSPGRTTSTDTDRDGATDYAEWIAGTDPNGSDSKPFVYQVEVLGDREIRITWPSVLDRTYALMSSSDAVTWARHIAPIRATAEETSATITLPATENAWLFKIEVVQ